MVEINRERLSEIDMYISQLLSEQKTIGFTAAILMGSDVVLAKSFGALSASDTNTCDLDTIFSIGSVSKSFTCLAILLLEEAGKLSIEDPISKHLPLNFGGKEEVIKLKHLMSHSSGLPNVDLAVAVEKKYGARTDYAELNLDLQITTWEELFAYLNTLSDYITSKPGERFHYSDTSFALLSYIITNVSGMSYGEYLRNFIFTPLEMHGATTRSEFVDKGNAADTHVVNMIGDKREIVAVGPNYPISALLDGGGGIMASNHNMQNYLYMMAHGGKFRNRQIISAQIYHKLTSPYIAIDAFNKRSYGYGWIITDLPDGNPMIFHTGNTGAATTWFGFIPADEFGIFTINSINSSPHPVIQKIISTITDLEIVPRSNTFSAQYSHFVGKFENMSGIQLAEIENRHGELYLMLNTVSVYGKKYFEGPIHQAEGLNEFYVIENNMMIRMYLDNVGGSRWLTVGINKFKQIS